ncbi:MAG: hypothetical protein WC865_10210 [Bacteroidales bacterium]
MKTKNSILGMAGLFIGALLLFSSCKKDDPIIVDKQTKITGTAKLQAGVSGNLGNAQVAIYMSTNDWDAYNPVAIGDVSGSGAKISFVFNDVVPGNYYLDVWVDADNSGDWSAGDLVGWYGSGALSSPSLSPFMVAEGKTYNHTIACGVF